MIIAVVTPYCSEPGNVLSQCIKSVQKQGAVHYLVSDGSNVMPSKLGHYGRYIDLFAPHHDYGNFARGVGALAAVKEGFDAICFLDADNWYENGHVEKVEALAERENLDVVTTRRNIVDLDGRFMFVDTECDGVNHVDTSCFFVRQNAFHLLPMWLQVPREVSALGDRLFLKLLQGAGLRIGHIAIPTVNYRTRYRVHYEIAKRTPPENAVEQHVVPKDLKMLLRTFQVETGK